MLPSAVDMRAKLLAQIQTIEYLALFREFIEACDSTSESGDPTMDLLDGYVAMHRDQGEAFENLEQLTRLWQCDDWRQYLVHHMKQHCGADEEDYMVELRMARLVDLGTDRVADMQTQPFDQLLAEVEACRALPDGENRRRKRQELLADLRSLTREHYLTADSYGGGEEERWVLSEKDDELYCPRNVSLRCNVGGAETHVKLFSVQKILDTIRRIQFEELVNDSLVPVDHERIKAETLEYGAKTANLREVVRVLPSLRQLLERNYVHINVPRFEGMPASLYDLWSSGEDIDPHLHRYYEWIGRKSVYVRSSAVYSEDNAGATGAGIYHSEQLPGGATFDEFKAAVIRVFSSVDCEHAVQYRKSLGIEDEKMGITLQDAIDEYAVTSEEDYDDWDYRGRGFLNSARAYAPELCDVVTGENSRLIFVKDRVEQYLVWGDMHGGKDMYFYNPDIQRRGAFRSLRLQENAAFLGSMLEKAYGLPVQCEFVSDGKAIQIVQTRILPEAHHSTAKHIEFPDEKPLIVRDATGVLDEELPILPHSEENAQKKGLVVFLRSYYTSDLRPERYFPKEGAVMVLDPSKEMGGHIETVCIEKGLVCIFSSKSRLDEWMDEPDLDYGESAHRGWGISERLPNITGFNGYKRVRVVANGMEARLYPAASKPSDEVVADEG